MKIMFLLSLILFVISCGKDISNAIASVSVKSAAFRTTRQKIVQSATFPEKDALCKQEFGSSYALGSDYEADGLGVNVTFSSGPEGSNSNPIVYMENFSSTSTTESVVFCIKE